MRRYWMIWAFVAGFLGFVVLSFVLLCRAQAQEPTEIQPDLRLTPYAIGTNKFTIQPPTQLQFAWGGKTVFSVAQDGTVTLGEGFTADDASREIWRQIEYNLRARAQCKEDQK
jgi:hypothetical protein